MEIKFEDVIREWKASNGGRIPGNSEERKASMRDLIVTLVANGFEESLHLQSNQNRIINACVNPGHDNHKKLQRWKDVVTVDLDTVMHEYFEKVKIIKASSEDFKVKTPPHKEYVPKAKPQPEKESEASSSDDSSDEEFDDSYLYNSPPGAGEPQQAAQEKVKPATVIEKPKFPSKNPPKAPKLLDVEFLDRLKGDK